MSRVCNRKAVVQLDKDNNLIAIYSTMSEASAAVGVNIASISRSINGLQNKAGGFYWRLATEEEGMVAIRQAEIRRLKKKLQLLEDGDGHETR